MMSEQCRHLSAAQSQVPECIFFYLDPSNTAFSLEVVRQCRLIELLILPRLHAHNGLSTVFPPWKFVVASVQIHLVSFVAGVPCEGISRATEAVFWWGRCIASPWRSAGVVFASPHSWGGYDRVDQRSPALPTAGRGQRARGSRGRGREFSGAVFFFVASILREQLVKRERRTSYGMPAESSGGSHTPRQVCVGGP